MSLSSAVLLGTLPILVALFSCSASQIEESKEGHGTLELPLRSVHEERQFQLQNAQFRITGDEERLLDAENSEDSLRQSLPPGDYQIELLDGWSLTEVSDAGLSPLQATLQSLNPVPFSIRDSTATQVVFRFSVTAAGDEMNGRLEVALEVEWQTEQSVFFSELMKNPDATRDSGGEWIELANGGTAPFSLLGCQISRDTQSFAITDPLTIAPGAFVVLANGDQPGFDPALVYRGITLPNDSEYLLQLRCEDQVLDTVSIVPSAFPNQAGASMSLSPSRWSAQENDDPAAWCAGTLSYNGDLGTPGTGNPACPVSD